MPLQQTLEAARAAWEAAPDDDAKTQAYVARAVAAFMLDQMTKPDLEAMFKATTAAMRAQVEAETPGVVALAERILDMAPDLPPDVIAKLARQLHADGRELESVTVIEVDGGGIAHVKLKPSDGIGEPQGTA